MYLERYAAAGGSACLNVSYAAYRVVEQSVKDEIEDSL
jgi:hypothetical protein